MDKKTTTMGNWQPISKSDTEDDAVFKMLAETYASANPVINNGDNCNTDLPTRIVHGADWVARNHTILDYVYNTRNTFMVCVFRIKCCL